jgi:4-amino-4-deoxy-L-arabinose transferase-like glycosyltransferase
VSDLARGEPTEEGKTLTEEMLGDGFFDEPWVKRVLAWRPRYRTAVLTALFAGLVFIPNLGAVGLWDCWETHYGEVARSMIERHDFVYPWWESAYFFSKPVLTMWIMALGMLVVGTNTPEGAVSLYTEWGMRLPFALWSITAVALLSLAVSRTVSRRAGLATGFILVTMPLYFLLTRQAVTDPPLVSALGCAMACALIGLFDETTPHRAGWWYGFWFFCGLATLAKGLLGIALPATVLVLYAGLSEMDWSGPSLAAHGRWLVSAVPILGPAVADWTDAKDVREGRAPMPVLWAKMYEMKFLTGFLVFCAVAVPWYMTLSLFDGVDDESKDFFTRFFIHDHFNRLGAGVHTTTPGGTFTYFIEQAGFAIFPWVALVPGAIAVVSRVKLRSVSKADRLAIVALLWATLTFAVIGASATKFHHYVFPVLPPLAILLALFADRLWVEGIGEHGVSMILGLVLFALVGHDLATTPKNFTDLFVYNYDRPYPIKLVTQAITFGNGRTLYTGNIVAIVLVAVASYLAWDAFTAKTKSLWYRGVSLYLLATGLFMASLVLTASLQTQATVLLASMMLLAIYLAFEGYREKALGAWIFAGILAVSVLGNTVGWSVRPEMMQATMGQFLRVFTPSLLQTVNIRTAMGFAFLLGGGVAVIGAMMRSRTMVFGSFWALAFAFTLWFNWFHWPDLSHHWTQRDLFWRYYKDRRPDEPIAAFLMNWRGETFYSKNEVKQIKDNARMAAYAAQPGREWALVEHERLRILQSAVGPERTVTPLTTEEMNNKFVLVTIE